MNANINIDIHQNMFLLNHEVQVLKIYKSIKIAKVKIVSTGIITTVGLRSLKTKPDNITSIPIIFFRRQK